PCLLTCALFPSTMFSDARLTRMGGASPEADPKLFRNSSETPMSTPPSLSSGPVSVFGPFRMDLARERLWRDGEAIRLRPKSWDVLRYLVERPGLLITKEAIHQEVWHDTAVSDDTLTQSIGELRRVLGDDPRTPRFIETVHGRGFR